MYNPPPYFTITGNHEKSVEPPTPKAWRNYWTAPDGTNESNEIAVIENLLLNMKITIENWMPKNNGRKHVLL